MSVASSSSIPCIKLHNYASYSPSSSSPTLKFTIRSSQAEGPIRRPVVPTPVKPDSPMPSAPPKPVGAADGVDKNVITLEFQRQKARELQEYFKQKKIEEDDQGPFFGFISKNEVSNGRWAIFGFAVGMLTEYATGSDFVDQLKILLSNFGILDLE
ncbi:light-harvesting complex-like protein OHP2, chloroplastic [Primulina huaijiensis]|uniref:light-harvesting complex-like protein OHP2, chloroplastic n=1 Tax=Primulina huaijiensis TaxID=1492673 RepID=UPI003CC744B8